MQKGKISLAAKLFVIFFCGALVTLMLINAVKTKETYSYYENRNLAVFPEITRETLLNGEWGAAVDRYLADHAAGRDYMLAASTIFDAYILQQPLVNEVVIGDDILLPEIQLWMLDTSTIPTYTAQVTENLKELDTLVESYGGQYYFVVVPCQYAHFPDEYPWYIDNRADYTAQSRAALSASLQAAGVNFIDIGDVFAEYGWADYLSSKIDNHYSIHGAYLTYLEIMERINADREDDLDILTEGEYEIRELPNPYLGSRLRKLLKLWPSDEKLGILTPNTEVPFTRKDNWVEVAPTVYAMPADDTSDVLYSLYMGGDIAFTEIHTNREELPSILVYGDSFTNAVECILYYGFDTMYTIDLRHYTATSLGEFIEQYQPDVVVCIRDYESMLWATGNGCGVTK